MWYTFEGSPVWKKIMWTVDCHNILHMYVIWINILCIVNCWETENVWSILKLCWCPRQVDMIEYQGTTWIHWCSKFSLPHSKWRWCHYLRYTVWSKDINAAPGIATLCPTWGLEMNSALLSALPMRCWRVLQHRSHLTWWELQTLACHCRGALK